MKVTRITEENSAYFEDLAPEGALEDECLLWLGAIAGDGGIIVSSQAKTA